MIETILSAKKEPFSSEGAARASIKQQGLDPNACTVEACEGGFCIKYDKTKETPKEKYFRVVFSAMSSPNDTPDVILPVNGEVLNIQREREVIIPERFKVCADNATYLKFSQEPGKPRKTIGRVKFYPYTMISEATEEEYLAMKAEGDRITRENIRKYGHEYVPDEAEMGFEA